MSEIATLVQATIRTSSPIANPLPSIIWLPFKGIHFVHRLWRTWRHASLYTNPCNFPTIAAAHAGAGQIPVLREVALAALIGSRISECIDEQMKLYQNYKRGIHTIKGHYLPRPSIKWTKQSKSIFISPSTDLWFKTLAFDVQARIKKLSYHTLMIITGLFQTSMLTIDTIESFSFSAEKANQGVMEFSRNSAKIIDTLANNGEELLNTITKHKAVIQKIFAGRNIPVSVDSLIEILSKSIQKVNLVNEATKKGQHAAAGLMVDLAKKGGFGFLVSTGMSELIPNVMVPKLNHPWETQPKSTLKYPPIEWVTRPSKLPSTAKSEAPKLNPPTPEIPTFKHPEYFPLSEAGQKHFQTKPGLVHLEPLNAGEQPDTESRSRTINWLNNSEV